MEENYKLNQSEDSIPENMFPLYIKDKTISPDGTADITSIISFINVKLKSMQMIYNVFLKVRVHAIWQRLLPMDAFTSN